MGSHSPSPGILETVITEDSLLEKDVSLHASRGEDATALSKRDKKRPNTVKDAFDAAKSASEAQNAKSRQICAVQRAKREGTDPPVVPVIREEPTAKAQTLLSDF